MKFIKKTLKWLLILFVVLNTLIVFTGHSYLYKAVWNTYVKGRSGPSVDEYTIFENRKVEKGIHDPWKIHARRNSVKIPADLLADFEKYESIAYVIIKNDSLIHEQYWDGYSDTSHTNSFSVAKTFVSILTGIAITEGKIKGLDQDIGEFLPEYKGKGISIRHLLTMSSGINFDESYENPLAYPAKAYYGKDLEKLTLGYEGTETPGKVFRYLSGNTMLLALIIEKATGKTISEYFSEKVWKETGASQDAYWSLDDENGKEKAYCCFNSNAKDFARIGQLYLDSGKWAGKQLVARDYVLESAKAAPLVDADGDKNEKYGFNWWVLPDHKGHYIYYARGILGQYIICIPDERMVVVRLGKKREKAAGNAHPADLFWYIDAALKMYGSN